MSSAKVLMQDCAWAPKSKTLILESVTGFFPDEIVVVNPVSKTEVVFVDIREYLDEETDTIYVKYEPRGSEMMKKPNLFGLKLLVYDCGE